MIPASTKIGYRRLGCALGPPSLGERRAEADEGGDTKAGELARWTVAAFAASATMASLAVAGEHWKFNVVNKSNTAALEFRTQEDGKWSANWITERIEPGDTFNMDFGVNKGDCAVRTQIHFADGGKFDAPVDYCKVTNIYIRDDGLTWD